MALYAAYGSNLDPEQMLMRAPHSPAQGTGWLTGWRLTFGGEELSFEGALATVVEDAGSQVFVMLYDVPPFDEPELDRWEGNALGLYSKIRVRVATLEGDVRRGSTCSTATRAACRRRATSVWSPTPPRQPARLTITSPTSGFARVRPTAPVAA